MQSFQLSSGATINIDGKVDEEIIAGEKYIILFNRTDSNRQSQTPSDNVHCFDSAGKLLWIVEKREYDDNANPYTFIKYFDEKLFKTSTFQSTRMLLLSVESGKFVAFAP